MRNVTCKTCANLKNDWCSKKNDSPDPELVRDCPHWWELTNARKIRTMTDEDLAALMASWCKATVDCPCCPWYSNCPGSEHDFDWLDWLQQPYMEVQK